MSTASPDNIAKSMRCNPTAKGRIIKLKTFNETFLTQIVPVSREVNNVRNERPVPLHRSRLERHELCGAGHDEPDDDQLDFTRHQYRAVPVHTDQRQFIQPAVLSGEDLVGKVRTDPFMTEGEPDVEN